MSPTTHCCYSFSFLILALSYLPSSSLVRAELFFGNFDTNSNPVYIGVAFAALTFVFALSFIGFNFCCKTTPDTSIRAWSGLTGQGGLDPSLLLGFPVFTYSDVEGHRPDDGPLECAVCLGEFEATETLRLLPKCNHVFHVGCVDTWLSAHATCPLCRTNLVPEPGVPALENEGRVSGLGGQAREVVNDVVEVRQNAEEGHFRKFRRWSSTGHIANNFERVEESWERHTLRLPEEVTRDIIARKINRSNSCRQFCIKVV